MKVWKAKEYLLEHGRIKEIKQGRISNDNHAFLGAAAADGIKFSDYTPKEIKSDTVKVKGIETKKVTVIREKAAIATNAEYRSPDEYRYPESLYKAVLADTGKAHPHISMRSACNNCGVSLLDHRCNEPRALSRAVNIVAR